MPNYSQKRKISPLAIIAIILILLALGMLFLIFAPGPRMKWALTMGEKYLTDCEYTQAVTMFSHIPAPQNCRGWGDSGIAS